MFVYDLGLSLFKIGYKIEKFQINNFNFLKSNGIFNLKSSNYTEILKLLIGIFFTSFWCKFEANLLGLAIYSKFLIGDLGLSINEDWLSV